MAYASYYYQPVAGPSNVAHVDVASKQPINNYNARKPNPSMGSNDQRWAHVPAPALSEFTFGSDAFSWPTAWFDVPAVSPLQEHYARRRSIFNDQYASDLDADNVPELDHSKTPESLSPTQLHETCITPSQDGVSAVCDVPLLAPRPVPYTSPTFLQFDYLPEDDEDLSYPPYTHSRKHRKRPLQDATSTPVTTPTVGAPISQQKLPVQRQHDALEQPSAKRRKVSEPYAQRREPAVVGVDASWIPQSSSSSSSHPHFPGAGQPHLFPQLVDYFGRTQSDAVMMGWI